MELLNLSFMKHFILYQPAEPRIASPANEVDLLISELDSRAEHEVNLGYEFMHDPHEVIKRTGSPYLSRLRSTIISVHNLTY